MQIRELEYRINKNTDPKQIFSIIIHEVFHLYIPDASEFAISTLESKLAIDIERIHHVLVENCYQRAAFIAHRKISYKPEGEKDCYNKETSYKVPVPTGGEKYREKKNNIVENKSIVETEVLI